MENSYKKRGFGVFLISAYAIASIMWTVIGESEKAVAQSPMDMMNMMMGGGNMSLPFNMGVLAMPLMCTTPNQLLGSMTGIFGSGMTGDDDNATQQMMMELMQQQMMSMENMTELGGMENMTELGGMENMTELGGMENMTELGGMENMTVEDQLTGLGELDRLLATTRALNAEETEAALQQAMNLVICIPMMKEEMMGSIRGNGHNSTSSMIMNGMPMQ